MHLAWIKHSKLHGEMQDKKSLEVREGQFACGLQRRALVFLFSLTECISTVKIETVKIKYDSLNSMVYLDLRHMQGGGKRAKEAKRERKRGCVLLERTYLSYRATISEVIDWKFQYSISVFLLLSYISSITKAMLPSRYKTIIIMTTAAAGILLQHSHQLWYMFLRYQTPYVQQYAIKPSSS